jgi:hypothetical protein
MHKCEMGMPELRSGSYTLVENDEDGRAQPVFLFAPKRHAVEGAGDWIISWQDSLMTLAKDRRLNLTDWRVIAVLQARLDYDNWIRISHSEIGLEIDVARPNVSKSMKRLTEIGVLLVGPSSGNITTYQLNPTFGWKGGLRKGAKERRAALRLIKGGMEPPAEPLEQESAGPSAL